MQTPNQIKKQVDIAVAPPCIEHPSFTNYSWSKTSILSTISEFEAPYDMGINFILTPPPKKKKKNR